MGKNIHFAVWAKIYTLPYGQKRWSADWEGPTLLLGRNARGRAEDWAELGLGQLTAVGVLVGKEANHQFAKAVAVAHQNSG